MITADTIATHGRVHKTNAVLISTCGRVVGAVGDIIREVIRLISTITRSIGLRSTLDENN